MLKDNESAVQFQAAPRQPLLKMAGGRPGIIPRRPPACQITTQQAICYWIYRKPIVCSSLQCTHTPARSGRETQNFDYNYWDSF